MIRFSIVLVAGALLLAGSVHAQSAAVPDAAAARISVPFNPPLERPLRYRATTTKPRARGPAGHRLDRL